jgi:hypothetical protein
MPTSDLQQLLTLLGVLLAAVALPLHAALIVLAFLLGIYFDRSLTGRGT